MKVTVFGIGYVGLVQATVLAEVGHDVMCVDVDAKKVENLKNGVIPIFEPGLAPLVKKNYEEGRLSFTTDAEKGWLTVHCNLLRSAHRLTKTAQPICNT